MIAIPSSIHEFLLLPLKEGAIIFSELVRSVNCEEVIPEEQLSDYAYILDFSDGEKINWEVIK